jgi:uncharacterized protein (DUF362 family)
MCADFAIKAACDFVINHGGKPLVAEGTKWPGGTRGVFLQMGCESLLEGRDRLVDTLTDRPEQRMVATPGSGTMTFVSGSNPHLRGIACS